MMEQIFSKVKGDRWIWIIVLILSMWSVLAVYSATGTIATTEDGHGRWSLRMSANTDNLFN